jgi:hypothetical protein
MVHFQTNVPWIALKSNTSVYFSWLKACRVYLNHSKFKADTLVSCGFLVGAQPSHFRRDGAEEELRASLGITPDSLPFQLSSRSISVPMKEGDPSQYCFQAIVIETPTQHAQTLCKKFYDLDQPTKAQANYPYTGISQFVPLRKTKEWPISKIFQLAQFHVTIVEGLKPLFLGNIQDINHVIDDLGNSLMQGFYGMTVMSSTSQGAEGITPPVQLIHSIHNTRKPNTKVILVQTSKFNDAVDQFSNIHNILQTKINESYHENVFVPGTTTQLAGRKADSISSAITPPMPQHC